MAVDGHLMSNITAQNDQKIPQVYLYGLGLLRNQYSNTSTSEIMDSKIMGADIHDASFSAYLNTSVESFVVKLAESARSPNSLEKTKTKEGDISVFGAEKYFNVKSDGKKLKALDINTPSNSGITEKVHYQQTGPRSRPGTPNVISEASWNSQAALIQASLRNSSQGWQKKISRKWMLACFSCNRCCSDEDSIFVRKTVPEGAVHGQELMKQSIQVAPNAAMRSQQSIPVNREEEQSGMQRLNVKKPLKEEEERNEEEEELEVIGSKIINKGDVQWYLERKLSMLTWDAIPKPQNVTTSSASSQIYADLESEGSSDLFEIENLSGSRKAQYDLSFMTSTTTTTTYEQSLTDTEAQRSRPSSLLGCKSPKAVRVAENA